MMRQSRLLRVMLWVGLCALLVSGLAGCGGLSAQEIATETAAAGGAATPGGEQTGTPQGGTSQPGGGVVATVQVTEQDFEIILDQDTAPPGQIQFNLTNQGPSEHEFVIFKTDLDPANLPVQGNMVDETASGVQHIDEQEQFPAGETRTLTVNLEPGKYVFICNLPGHYQLGMRVPFTVTQQAGPTTTGVSAGGAALAQASPAASGTPAGGTPTGGTPPAAARVVVIEEDGVILMNSCLMPAGEIEFDLRNLGPSEHEFVILQTDLPPNSLPVQNAMVDENAPGLQKVAEQEAYPAGETRTLTTNLQPGNYVAICNLEGHYQLGMFFGFTVVEVFPGGALGQMTPGTTASPARPTTEGQATPGGTPTGGQAAPAPGVSGGQAGTATAPGGQATTTGQATIQVTEQDFQITLDKNTAPAGPIQFNLTNQGPSEHEFVIFKTDLDPANLPVQGNMVNETASGLQKIDEQEAFPAGETRTLTVNLEPGKYVFICNLPGHYQLGMHVSFTVTGS